MCKAVEDYANECAEEARKEVMVGYIDMPAGNVGYDKALELLNISRAEYENAKDSFCKI